MDPTQRLRVERRDRGARRQRRVTQWAAAGAAALAAVFGWVFAQSTTASADTTQPTDSAQTTGSSQSGPSDNSGSGSGLRSNDDAPGAADTPHSDTQSGGS